MPFNVEEVFGTNGQVKVRAYFDGFEYRESLVNMDYLIIITEM
ncbi:DUF1905 domain-containing protein [Oceanobacillus chungangensis]|uniref:Uncharacterized protein n=1 Tax=Oceanobacillus chungangensis TaxID=1229152 RepID=A0A3D8PWY1_9BACI|nr:hypothetical protein CWR45_07075 [Oceanobacillus chungangensis]